VLKKLASGPYLIWIVLFIVVPILMVGFFSLVQEGPDGTLTFTTANFQRVFDPIYVGVWWRSIKIALEATLICLILGYPTAFILSKMKKRIQTFAVMLFIVPMWMNFLLRTYAWMTILGKNGILNQLLALVGLPQMTFLYSEGAVLLGMVYNFLPFMVLPIYTVLAKMDQNLIEAAEDLGGNRRIVFTKVILPLSLPGVISGVSMVFMPAVTTFVIPNLLGSGKVNLIGNVIEQQFLMAYNWHFGSALSLVLMVLILISMGILQKVDPDHEEGGGLI